MRDQRTESKNVSLRERCGVPTHPPALEGRHSRYPLERLLNLAVTQWNLFLRRLPDSWRLLEGGIRCEPGIINLLLPRASRQCSISECADTCRSIPAADKTRLPQLLSASAWSAVPSKSARQSLPSLRRVQHSPGQNSSGWKNCYRFGRRRCRGAAG